MKKSILLCCAVTVILFSCRSKKNNTAGSEITTDRTPETLVDKKVAQTNSFGSLFTGSPQDAYGSLGCQQQTTNCTTESTGQYNGNWTKYFTSNDTSMTMTAGDDCRTVNSGSNNQCVFNLGDTGVTQIKFDFSISDSCHGDSGTDWLAFWIYSNPWKSTAEVDFIEGCNGANNGGLNTNFDDNGQRLGIFTKSQPNWQGTITANFSGTGNNITVNVTNSVNNQTATATLTQSNGYFFVLDTAPINTTGCTVTISNLTMQGSVGQGQCFGLITTPRIVQK